jgi:hypothetical protein|tara:strand:+ start:421 stop:594 length:174 start_codon:yes stop_codon:yes gene_type:complete
MEIKIISTVKKVNTLEGEFTNHYLVNGIHFVPKDEENRDYQKILLWVADDNTIEEAD